MPPEAAGSVRRLVHSRAGSRPLAFHTACPVKSRHYRPRKRRPSRFGTTSPGCSDQGALGAARCPGTGGWPDLRCPRGVRCLCFWCGSSKPARSPRWTPEVRRSSGIPQASSTAAPGLSQSGSGGVSVADNVSTLPDRRCGRPTDVTLPESGQACAPILRLREACCGWSHRCALRCAHRCAHRCAPIPRACSATL
jgi:hypothetical protein